jgi:anti-sigma B factor antagonist
LSPLASYLVARTGTTVYVRAVGLANMKNAPMLDAFLQEEIRLQATTACVDLSACTGMDSTFMGVMVGFSLQLVKTSGRLVIVNPSEHNLRLLEMLGISAVVPVLAHCSLDEGVEFVNLPAATALTPLQRAELVKRAHQNLVALTESNNAKFTPFLTALEADLARRRGQGPAG